MYCGVKSSKYNHIWVKNQLLRISDYDKIISFLQKLSKRYGNTLLWTIVASIKKKHYCLWQKYIGNLHMTLKFK